MSEERSQMGYRAFVRWIEGEVEKEYLGKEIQELLVEKTDVSYLGLVVKDHGDTFSAVTNLDELYERYKQGVSQGELIDIVKQTVAKVPRSDIVGNAEKIKDYAFVKERLYLRVHRKDANIPKSFIIKWDGPAADLLVTAHILLSNSPQESASVGVTKEMFAMWGISKETLWQDAMENQKRIDPPVVMSMGEALGFPNHENSYLTVLTSKSRVDGASYILDQEALDQAASKYNTGNCLVLPSSVHEVLMVSAAKMDWREAERMVREVNRVAVKPEEQLSGFVYHWDSREKALERADLRELRMLKELEAQEKGEAEKDKNKRGRSRKQEKKKE